MKLTEIGPPPGVKDLQTLLRFLDDPEAYDKRLAKMEQLRDELNKAMDNLGGMRNIEQTKQAAVNDRRKAALELEQAQQKSKTMMSDIDAGIEENERRSKELDERERIIKTKEQNIARKQHELRVEGDKQEAVLEAKLKELQKERAQLSALHKEQKEKAERLKVLADAM